MNTLHFTTEAALICHPAVSQPMLDLGRIKSGIRKGVSTKGVFSLEKSLESPNSLNSLESLEHGRIFLVLAHIGRPLESFSLFFHALGGLESLNSRKLIESLENGQFSKGPFSKTDPD